MYYEPDKNDHGLRYKGGVYFLSIFHFCLCIAICSREVPRRLRGFGMTLFTNWTHSPAPAALTIAVKLLRAGKSVSFSA